MEKAPKNKSGNESGAEQMSLVERKRQEAFATVCDALDERLSKGVGPTYESGGRSYELTSAEDCMVAFAQSMKNEIVALHKEIVEKNDYREEQAAAKLLALINTYERLIALYAELRSYYPKAAARVEEHIPSLNEMAAHGKKIWEKVKAQKK
jgi:hypothetical protein